MNLADDVNISATRWGLGGRPRVDVASLHLQVCQFRNTQMINAATLSFRTTQPPWLAAVIVEGSNALGLRSRAISDGATAVG
jgi:hypothetical protein